MRQWFAVKTKPRREFQACAILAERGIEAYVPSIPTQKRADRGGTDREPLFPGYLFSRLQLRTPEWISARSAPGVAYFLGVAGEPTPLPQELVETIRARADSCLSQGWNVPFQTGDQVLIENGPFAGLDAIFERSLSASGRVRVLLEIVNRLVPIDLDVRVLHQRPRLTASNRAATNQGRTVAA
jgi:transcription elongation factor/antiterminator RfaH